MWARRLLDDGSLGRLRSRKVSSLHGLFRALAFLRREFLWGLFYRWKLKLFWFAHGPLLHHPR
ncbi:hypothetical protein [Candidatus Methylomirabilis sp.]|uniref:hypothetical protein n=1 Tax=Candidatus Methylomirabilis sp. TaxID=2032687 RepID=UPI003C73A38B